MASFSVVTTESTDADSTTSGLTLIEPLDGDLFDKSPLKCQVKPLAELSKVLGEMVGMHDRSKEFLNPVDCDKHPTYAHSIKHPMDLSTTLEKLLNNEYLTADELASDVRLIFSNCKSFNEDDSKIWDDATFLENFFEAEYGRIRKSYACSLNTGSVKIKPILTSMEFTPELTSEQKLHLRQRIEAVEKRTQRHLTRMFNKLLLSGSSEKEATNKVLSYLEWHEKRLETEIAEKVAAAAEKAAAACHIEFLNSKCLDLGRQMVSVSKQQDSSVDQSDYQLLKSRHLDLCREYEVHSRQLDSMLKQGTSSVELKGAPAVPPAENQLEGSPPTRLANLFGAAIHGILLLASATRAFFAACLGACLAFCTMLFHALAYATGIFVVALFLWNVGWFGSCLRGLASFVLLAGDLLHQLVRIGFELGGDLVLLLGTVGDRLDQLVGIAFDLGGDLRSSTAPLLRTVGDSLNQLVRIGFDLSRDRESSNQLVRIGFDLSRDIGSSTALVLGTVGDSLNQLVDIAQTMAIILFWLLAQAYFFLRDTTATCLS